MKFTVEIDGRQQELDVVRRRDVLLITRDGETVEVRVVHRDGPHFVLEIEERQGAHVRRRRLRAAGHSDGDRRQLWVNGSNLYYHIVRQDSAASAAPASAGALSSSIPAVVSEILVAPGDRVSAGQKLILLESMKMILPIQAPHDGAVSAIHCQPGDAVQPGVKLVEIGE